MSNPAANGHTAMVETVPPYLAEDSNWTRWERHFLEEARQLGLLGLFTGFEALISEPTQLRYNLRRPGAANGVGTSGVIPSLAHPGPARDAEFNQAYTVWTAQYNRVQAAFGLLRQWVDPTLYDSQIQAAERDPARAYARLVQHFRMSPHTRIHRINLILNTHYLANFASMEHYIRELIGLLNDLRYLGQDWTPREFIARLLAGLTPAFALWVRTIGPTAAEHALTQNDIVPIMAALFAEEGRLNDERDQ